MPRQYPRRTRIKLTYGVFALTDAGIAAMMDSNNGPPSTAVLEQLGTEVGILVEQELALAKAEMAENAASAALGLASALGAALLGACVALLLVTSLVLGLATAMPAWLAALLVAAGLMLIAVAIAAFASSRLRGATLLPRRTNAWIKEDMQWYGRATRSETRT